MHEAKIRDYKHKSVTTGDTIELDNLLMKTALNFIWHRDSKKQIGSYASGKDFE